MTALSPRNPNHSGSRRTQPIDTRHSTRSSVLTLILLWLCLTLPATAMAENTVLVFGDSLSAAYGIAEEDGWVTLLEEKLAETHPQWQVRNASVSGETTGGGLRRINKALDHHTPEIVILQLGGNDGLRGKDPQTMRNNLATIIERSKDTGAKVLLIGIEIPPNYGQQYTTAFRNQYQQLANNHEINFLPFLLEDIYNRNGMMQNDGIHPTAEAQPLVLENVWEKLEPML
ncbi:acyl-CoA thioesterase-1 [Halospina denitrificans]|uniref:Acyl-CoA thioesterase-1 n=2 Tax=Halospina denitrificans TaxID=332522 RepID=A0A4R7JZL8_9GAMM|nr:acyl-CoA thioesterase-1 [Halospina denitrificans]